ncbi:DedA family protein [Umezakia ovalisporum]|jgi:membrane-associated protein|uniref:DedA family protein n=1 Tax=Umezakia ovalisporum FSS-43 TaxID=2740520 RepID=A0ABT6K857_9CYAN|nr:DedA family protein [Umezakia ovalisporum]MBI1241468.1 DedA family protein [Nostoc sp. RI_552]MDH6058588.1 DedA family protein [Umezakia ovalisporum FSS-43]MDH6067553.1 DedA family protein [Umezakia ovalisporum APH033B]MDH6069511.1 DedA family protein [Umezakia ovalisporum CobakiLakeA]MDH6075361.1 DedA family protein [Umezakia ovalisporum CS-1034]
MSLDLISLENIQEFAHQYGYWAVFLGILLENLGIPLPGETVTLVGGFLAGSKELNYWLVLSDAVVGAVIGGACGYWIGKFGGWPFLVQVGKLFRISDERLLNIKDQFSENATKAVFFGRFFPLLRIFAAPLAGIAEMPFRKFFLYNLLGATLWGSVMVTLAFFAGKVVSLEQLVDWVSKFAMVALLILVALIAIPIWLESRQVNRVTGE